MSKINHIYLIALSLLTINSQALSTEILIDEGASLTSSQGSRPMGQKVAKLRQAYTKSQSKVMDEKKTFKFPAREQPKKGSFTDAGQLFEDDYESRDQKTVRKEQKALLDSILPSVIEKATASNKLRKLKIAIDFLGIKNSSEIYKSETLQKTIIQLYEKTQKQIAELEKPKKEIAQNRNNEKRIKYRTVVIGKSNEETGLHIENTSPFRLEYENKTIPITFSRVELANNKPALISKTNKKPNLLKKFFKRLRIFNYKKANSVNKKNSDAENSGFSDQNSDASSSGSETEIELNFDFDHDCEEDDMKLSF